MAGSNEIRQKIVLDGEKQYRDAIRDAKRNLKTLRSELNAETAELGKNASEQQKNETRAKSLKAMIAEQEKIVKANKAALEEVRQKYGDNADALAQYEQRLNDSRTALANMRNELEGVAQSYRDVGGASKDSSAMAVTATNQVADALGKISGVGDSISSAIEGIFSAMVSRITQAAQEVWALIAETAAKANNWGDLAGIYGTDAQTIQMYSRTLQSLGKDFNTLNTIASRLAMGGKSKEITEALGISDVNYQDKWAYMKDVMDAMAEMQKNGEDLGDLMETVFGERKSAGLIDLLNDWETIQEKLPTFNGNETGYGMNDEQLQTMNDLSIQIDTITAKWEALKDRVAAGLGTMVMPLLVNVEGAMDGIASWLAAGTPEEKEAALAEVRKNIENFFQKLGEIIKESLKILEEVGKELQESDDPVTKAIGDILVTLQGALQWMIDNADKVKTAFEVIFGAWLVGKLTAVAGQLSSILMQIEAIKAFKGVSIANGAADAATGAAGGGLFAGLLAKGKAALSSLGNFLTSTGAKVGGGLLSFLWAMMPNNPLFAQSGNSEDDPIYQAQKAAYEKRDAGQKLTPEEEALLNPRPVTSLKYWEENEPEEKKPEKEKKAEEKSGFTPAQFKALEDYWDVVRDETSGQTEGFTAWAAVEEAFGGSANRELLDLLNSKILELYENPDRPKYEDIPENWYLDEWKGGIGGNTGNTDGMTSGDARSMTDAVNKLPGEVRRGLTGVKIYMDKTIVGQLVAEEVSRQIAASIM